MDINQNQQTNTFHKGMDTDTSDVLLGSDQYRYAENLRITVDGSGANGDLHTIEGTDRINKITPKFDGEDVLSFSSIRNICVAVLYNKTEKTWRIVKWNGETLSEDDFVTVFGPCSTPIWKTYKVEENGETIVTGEPELKTLSTVLRWESDKNVKFYIADGIHELISININNTEYPFRVVEGGSLTKDNVFELAFSYQGNGLPTMTATLSLASGTLKPAMVQYAYRLYILNGAASDISPLTKPIYLLKNKYEGYADTETTSNAVDLSFGEFESTGNIYIQIYRINYQKNGQLPATDIIVDQPFVSNFFVIDTGLSILSISSAEFLSELDTHIIPKIIESKGDIMYAANIKDGMSEAAEQFLSFDSRSYSSGNQYNGVDIFPDDYTYQNINFDNYDDISKLTHRLFYGGDQIAVWDKNYWHPLNFANKELLYEEGVTGDEIDGRILDYYIENNVPVRLKLDNPYQDEINSINSDIDNITARIAEIQDSLENILDTDDEYSVLNAELNSLYDQRANKYAERFQYDAYEKGIIRIYFTFTIKVKNDLDEIINITRNGTEDVSVYSSLFSNDNIVSKIKEEIQDISEDIKDSPGVLSVENITIEKYTILSEGSHNEIGPDGNPSKTSPYKLISDKEYTEVYNGVGKYIKWRYVRNDDNNPGYRSGEVYRFGIILYDKHGKASPVKWIADIMIPDYFDYEQPEEKIHYKYHIGIQFFVDIPKELNCSAYDIVRCDRDFNDRYTLFQGLVGFTTKLPSHGIAEEENKYYNPGFFTMDRVDTTHRALTYYEGLYNELLVDSVDPKVFPVKENLLMFACPEYCYNKTQTEDILSRYSNNIQLLIIDRRDVSSRYGYSTKKSCKGLNRRTLLLTNMNWKDPELHPEYYFFDDSERPWVHSPAINILSNNHTSLANAGLGFKFDTSEADHYLELTAGFVALQSNSAGLYQTVPPEGLEDGTWEGKLPWAMTQPNHDHISIFFNWFGQHEYPDDDDNWHTNTSPVLSVKDGVKLYSDIIPINYVSYATARDYNQFFPETDKDGSYIQAFDQIVSINNSVFINWSLGSINRGWIDHAYEPIWREDYDPNFKVSENDHYLYHFCNWNGDIYTDTDDYTWHDNRLTHWWYPVSGGDDLILLELSRNATRYNLNDATEPTSPRIYIANIKKPATPYGGYNEENIKRSKFYSFGNYVSLIDSNNYDNIEVEDLGGDIIHTRIIIGGGDTFVSHFKYTAAHWWHSSIWNRQLSKMCTIYDTVIETDVNLNAQHGYLYRTGRGYTADEYKIQAKEVQDIDGYTQSKAQYLYNSGYSCRPNLIPKTADTRTEGETDTFDTRIQYSNKKTNNESIDSWMDFKSNNFLDVDTRFGEITDLKLFKDKLMFWQNNATGIISTNERTILQNTDDASIILGDGSVLLRFDYVSLVYGQKPNQHTSCITNNNLYWWDEYRKEILHYMEGYNVSPLGTVKMVKNYLSSRKPVSVPTISYDVDNNEIICHVVYDGDTENEALVFNEAVQVFTGVYKFSPIFYTMCMDKLLMIGKDTENKDTLYQYGVKQDDILLFDRSIYPKVKFIVNKASDYTKTFDIQLFGGKFYGGGSLDEVPVKRNNIYDTHRITEALNPITFTYNTPLKQHACINGENAITNAEYDFRLTIPRDGEGDTENSFDKQKQWGNRLRGKLMEVELSSNSNNSDFALHYITTKYRISWN